MNGYADRTVRESILIVDDSPDNLRVLSEILKQEGYRVRPVSQGAMALESAQAAPPDLILLDVRMPEMDGYEVCRQLKADPLTATLPIIFVSALDEEESKVKGFEAGGVDYITKPFYSQEILARVHTHLSMHRMQHHLEELIHERTSELQDEIAERKRAEETLIKSERKYKDLQDASIDGHAWMDMKGHLIEVNHSYRDMMGYTEEELSKLNYNDITPPQWHALEQTILTQQILARGYSDIYEKELIKKDGAVFPVEIRAYLIKDAEGNHIGMRAIVKDITERKRAQEELQKHEQHLRSLAAALSMTEEQTKKRVAAFLHDNVAQSLVSCKLILDQEKQIASPETLREKLNLVSDTLGQVADNTQDLTFELASPTLYKLGLVPAIREWLQDYLETRHGIANGLEYTGQFRGLDDDTRAFIFKTVKEVCFNVIKHAHAQTVNVVLIARDDSVQVTISDDGIGFECDDVAQRSASGTGLGLFSIKEHVKHLGGCFLIESNAGEGTTIQLSVPATMMSNA
jgi:PAS domain S-box-containing protein